MVNQFRVPLPKGEEGKIDDGLQLRAHRSRSRRGIRRGISRIVWHRGEG